MSHVRITRPALRTVCLALAMGAAGSTATAGISYSFSTGASPYGVAGPLSAFASTDSVQGRFVHDPAAAFTQTTANGASVYNLSFLQLQGSVGARSFSDPGGYTAVGNDISLTAGAQPTDWLQLGADPTAASATKNILGFDVPGYRLVNVRLFWIEGQSTPGLIGDFTGSQAMPASLPSFNGRLALDFVPLTGGATGFVFFDGLTVQAIPEPGSYALMVGGLVLLLAAKRRPAQANSDSPEVATAK